MKIPKLVFKKLTPEAVIPHFAHKGDAGLDVYSIETKEIECLGMAIFSTGLSVKIPYGYELQVRARSGLAFKQGIGLVNGVGTIDYGYKGEIKIALINYGKRKYEVKAGDRIAQFVFAKLEPFDLRVDGGEELVRTDISGTHERNGGFGSSGV